MYDFLSTRIKIDVLIENAHTYSSKVTLRVFF
ncbi:hypothetical protein [Pseudomonas sp. FEN]|nr:hypothetical protein [Pseudomonas sp. FEN]